jgi:hypothetical protein
MDEPTTSSPIGYRLFHIGPTGRIEKSEEIEALGDNEALAFASSRLKELPIEVWQGACLIGKIEPHKS